MKKPTPRSSSKTTLTASSLRSVAGGGGFDLSGGDIPLDPGSGLVVAFPTGGLVVSFPSGGLVVTIPGSGFPLGG